MMLGDIASGDLFISSNDMKYALIKNLPSVVCAEREGVEMARVSHDYEFPRRVERVISDSADEQAYTNAMSFVNKHAGDYSLGILKEYFSLI